MIRSDAKTQKAPFILPEKRTPELGQVASTCGEFAAAGAPKRLSVEELIALRRRLDG
jgi:hypothetical protein